MRNERGVMMAGKIIAFCMLLMVVCSVAALADSQYQPFTNYTSEAVTASPWHFLEDDNQRVQVVGYGSVFTGSTTIPGETAFKPFSSTVKMEFANNTSTEPGVPVQSWTTDFHEIVTVLKGYIRFIFTRTDTDAVNIVVTPRRDK